jgi:4-hydroxybenzoate polyprenyltransferase
MGLALAALQSRALLLVLVAYLALSLGYSIYLKRLVLVDVVVLAALYTVRIIAGTVAIEVPLSSWLLAFSMFIFLSLALIKRSSELITVERMSRNATAGRDYRVEDRAVLTAMGVASGYIAIVVLALYIDSPEGRGAYGWPGLLWLACPTVLYWISRLWIKTARGEMHDDPLFFSLRDRASWIAFAAIVLVTLAAI